MSWHIQVIEPTEVTLTLADFFNSIEQNGLPQVVGSYWREDKSDISNVTVQNFEVTSACAMGQSALNLGVRWSELVRVINTQFKHGASHKRNLADTIIGRNDGHHWTYKTIANYYRNVYRDRLDETFTVQRVLAVEKG